LPDGQPHPRMRTADHLFPKARGGGTCGMHQMPNTVIACYECNQDKGSLGYLEYLERRGSSPETGRWRMPDNSKTTNCYIL
jgi:5-methylcytosine-specific restriction endonuclease McrA